MNHPTGTLRGRQVLHGAPLLAGLRCTRTPTPTSPTTEKVPNV
jgi:hypothetical protein